MASSLLSYTNIGNSESKYRYKEENLTIQRNASWHDEHAIDSYNLSRIENEDRGDRHTNVLILGGYRTGSTFVSELFGQNPDFLYVFEPGLSLKRACMENDTNITSEMYERTFSAKLMELFHDIYTCRFQSKSSQCYINDVKYDFNSALKIGRRHDIRYFMSQSKQARANLTIDKIKQRCRQYKHIAIKTIRSQDLNDVTLLVRDPIVNLKLIHLIRDPRGRMSSIVGVDNAKSSTIMAGNKTDLRMRTTASYCESQLQDLFVGQQMRGWMLHNYIAIRYEDIAIQPLIMTRKIYDFLGLNVPSQLTTWLKENTKTTIKGIYETSRNSKVTAQAWRTKMSMDTIMQIENIKYCNELIKTVGYRFASPDNLLNMNISYILPAPNIITLTGH
ncbi:carbohydrate sulfotransferase 1-like [Glandiceps talaboti]